MGVVDQRIETPQRNPIAARLSGGLSAETGRAGVVVVQMVAVVPAAEETPRLTARDRR